MAMTDEEIEKALECCIKGKCGFSCPYCDKNFAGVFHCDKMKKDALDYINRLKDEIISNQKMFDAQATERIAKLESELTIAQGTKRRLTIFDRLELHDKAKKETATAIFNRIEDIKQVCIGNVACGRHRKKNEAQIGILTTIQEMLIRDFGVEVDK